MLPYIILIQVIIAIFFPSISVGNRSLFLADLICLGWVGTYAVQNRKIILKDKFFLISATIIVISFLHGMVRPGQIEGLEFTEGSNFDFLKELVVAVRFLVWITGIRILWLLEYPKNNFQVLAKKTLSLTLVLSILILGYEYFSSGFKTFLGQLYGFDPNYFHWTGRSYGTFKSPLEGSAALTFLSLLLPLILVNTVASYSFIAIAITIIFLFTHSATPFLGAVAAPIALVYFKKSKTVFKIGSLLFILILTAAAVHFYSEASGNVMKQKLLDFMSRFGIWNAYFAALSSRFDHLLFGFGFAPFHTDSSYLFILTRTGIVGLICALLAMFGALKKYTHTLNDIFIPALLIAGLGLDIFIYRNVVYILMLWIVLQKIKSQKIKPVEPVQTA